MTTGQAPRRLRLVHLFPDLLKAYGDEGNVASLVARASLRGIRTEVDEVVVGDRDVPAADIFLMGGGQDREQQVVGRELARLGPAIAERIGTGTALLAVCGGYQNLSRSYRTVAGAVVDGVGILDASTVAAPTRIVGPVVARATPSLAATLAVVADGEPARTTIVGFENHAGRTRLGSGVTPFADVEIGAGNNGDDAQEGVLRLPGDDGVAGLRLGTYLHGPLLPRNPHLTDLILAAGLAHGGPIRPLGPADAAAEWRAHDRYAARVRAERDADRRLPPWARRFIDGPRSLIGF